jgi:beta-glucosidase-like glycosyl hydrolase
VVTAGVRQALAPVLDVARDARWGRIHETYGEEVLLVSAMGVAYTKGIQGADPRSGVLATAKHFLGYSSTEGGQNMAAPHVGRWDLYDVCAAPFEAAIRVAGLASVMNSYSEIDGPGHTERTESHYRQCPPRQVQRPRLKPHTLRCAATRRGVALRQSRSGRDGPRT